MAVADALSTMLALVDARCDVVGGIRAGGDWALRFEADVPVKLEAVVRGCCWHLPDDGPPVRLTAGDAVVLNDAGPVALCSDPHVAPVHPCDVARRDGFLVLGTGADVVLLGGHVELDAATSSLLTSALPPVLHAIATSADAEVVRQLLEQLLHERANARPGAGHAMAQHAQLLLLQVLRIGLEQGALVHPSWLRLLADPALAPAVTLLHDDPARAWRLTELADAAGMSRSHFAHRFRQAAGQAPLTYLAHWRVRLAQQALRTSDATVATLAERLGYASESSFSHAFTRISGVRPSHYRRLHRRRADLTRLAA